MMMMISRTWSRGRILRVRSNSGVCMEGGAHLKPARGKRGEGVR